MLGQGGLLDAGIGIVQDLQSGRGLAGVIGAVQKAGTAYNTFKGKDLKPIFNEEANAALKGVLLNGVPSMVRQTPNKDGGILFPGFQNPTRPGDRNYPTTTTVIPGSKT